jgi:phage gpG-like protein
MLIADLLDENERLTARVADLEENQAWLLALLKVALHQLHATYLRERRAHQAARERLGLDDDDDEAEWAA